MPAAPRPPLPLPSPPLGNHAAGIGLRPWGGSASDAAVLAEAWADPDIARWNAVPDARSEADAAYWISGEGARRDLGLAIDLVVFQMGDPSSVHGEVGLVVVEPDQGWAEVGFWLQPGSRGAGRARSALVLLTEWAFERAGITRLVGRTHPDNPRSAGVLAAAGYRAAGTLDDGTQVWLRDSSRPS
ncbi:MAG TPA: GNAT family N-acetyltransferase [Acidimicrobiales bacterium]